MTNTRIYLISNVGKQLTVRASHGEMQSIDICNVLYVDGGLDVKTLTRRTFI